MARRNELRFRGADRLRDQLNAEQKREIHQLYVDVYNDVRGEIDRLKNLPQTASTRLQIMRLKQVEEDVHDAYHDLYAGLEGRIVNNMTSVSSAVVTGTAGFLSSVGLSMGARYTSFTTDIVEDLYFGKVYKGNWMLSSAIWGDYKGVCDDVSRIVAKGVAEGKGTYDIAKALETYVNPNARKPWDWSRFYPGSKLKVDYNAVRLARTEISHAYQLSIIRQAAANPFASGIIWHRHGMHDCEFCDRMVAENPHPINDCPMDHPNGFCTYTIELTKSLDDIADEIMKWVNGGENERLDEYMAQKYIDKPRK